MPSPAPLMDIAHVIQQAVAPVFLLSGVAAMLNVLTNRLARVIDRARQFERDYHTLPVGEERVLLRRRLLELSKRARLANRAITLCTICALVICLVIIALFGSAVLDLNAGYEIAGLFVLAMLALIGGLVSFLQEIFIATTTVRIELPQDRVPDDRMVADS